MERLIQTFIREDMTRIAIASDHAGYHLKEALKAELARDGYEVQDFGTNSDVPVDYPERVQLIDEDDTGGLTGSLREKVANTRCADADKHLNKLGPADAEEGHFSLAGHRLGQKGFTGPRWPNQQHPFGDSPSQQRLSRPAILSAIGSILYFMLRFTV